MPPLPPDAALRLAAIVESSDDAIVSKDLNGIITSWNVGAERLFGYSADEAVGRSITMLIPADRIDEEQLVLGRIRRGERVEHFDTIRRRKDGRHVHVSLTISPIRDVDGRIVGASKIARNISDRVRMEEDLRASQRRLMSLASAATSLFGTNTVDGVLSAAIDLARDVFHADGYALWRVDDSGAWRIVRSFGLSSEFVSRVVTTQGGQPAPARVPFSTPLVCEDVSVVPALSDARDVYAREGLVSLVVFPLAIHGERRGTMVFYSRRPCRYGDLDVEVGSAMANLAAAALTNVELFEAQRRAREAADHARQQSAFLAAAGAALDASLDYEATLATVARLAVPTIADWCVVDILNDRGAVQRLAAAHIDPDKVALAHRLHERYPEPSESRLGVREVLRTGQPIHVTRIPRDLLDGVARDEEHRRLLHELQLTSYMCVPLLSHGQPFGAISFVSAESGREYTEDDLRFARDLATRASLAVENARAYARANEASRLKDEFLAILSHEMRTPLNAVLGYARMLRLGSLDAGKTAMALEVVERNATSLKQIIEDVLDVSRIVAGRMRLSVAPVDLLHVLEEACATVMPAAQAKGVRLDSVLDPNVPPVSGDPDRLQQIFWNLLSNAIKFTPRGGRVQVRLARVNSHVEVAVSDTGQGIAPEFLPFVFERFRQADSTFAREHGGLGLGLAIARQLAELHGGSIAVESSGAGSGATFTVSLPLLVVHRGSTASDPREQPVADRAAPTIGTVPTLAGLRVLAVDDEPDSLDLLRTVLEGAGAEVTTAVSAPSALALLGTSTPDVLVADIGMPGMDGLQLIREVRTLDAPARHVPAAALTAYARSQDRVTSLSSGFQMHLVKPIDPVELIVAVAALAARPTGP